MLSWIKTIFARKARVVDPYDQFVAALAEESERQGLRPGDYDAVARSASFGDPKADQLTTNLENYFRIWLATPPPQRSERVVRFVRSIREFRGGSAIDPAKLPGEFLPAVRSRALVSTTLIQSWILGASDESGEVAHAPLVGEFVAVLVRDGIDSISPLMRSNLDFAKLTFDAAMEHAMANFRARNPVVRFEVDPRAPGVFYSGNLEDFQSSLLLLQPGKDYVLPDLLGEPVAVVPSRNQFFVTGSDNIAGLGALLDTAEGAGQQAYYCSRQMLVWRRQGWEPFFLPAGTGAAARQAHISAEHRGSDYQFQKQLLDQLHDKFGRDTFVASLQFWEKAEANPSRFSVTTVTRGATGALVPEAERVGFVDLIIDPATGRVEGEPRARDIVIVTWADAMAIVGHLFEPVPRIYPPRFRMLGFPDSDAWLQLKQKASL